MQDGSYSLREIGADDRLPRPVVAQGDQPLRALDEARTFLSRRPACEIVEIWCEDRLVATMGRRFV